VTHLSDEAIAAHADGVLTGLARERAIRHTKACPECDYAVAVQREAVWALRAAPAPSLPSGLVERLRGVPQTTPISAPVPSALAPDGRAMLAAIAPVAAFVPPAASARRSHRLRPALGAAAALAVAGAVVAGSSGGVTSGHPSRLAPRGPAAGTTGSLVGIHAPNR
jgi:anti-sigma factor RsiW